ncbi:MAG: FKBP-type peptidyl-prolyl cis-trans isomerase [Fimbriimonadaceae bacterium]
MRFLCGSIAALVALACVGCGPKEPPPPKSYFSKLGFKDLKAGTGPEANEGDLVLVEYTGMLPGSRVPFDSNKTEGNTKDPLAFVIGQRAVVVGMEQGIKGMKVGGFREIEIPWKMGYGEFGSPPTIAGKQDLVFEVKLLAVVTEEDRNVFEYEDTKPGSGEPIKVGDRVEIHYVATYANGKFLDDTRKRGKTVPFTVGKEEVISGVEKGVIGMRVGGQRILTLPPETAWGAWGNTKTISGNQVLVITVDLVKRG